MEKLNYGDMKKGPTPSYTEQNRVDWFNASYFVKKERYDCPICKDKQMVAYLGTLGLPVIEPCQCANESRDRKRYADAMAFSGLGSRFLGQTFESFHGNKPWRVKMKKTAQTWAEGNMGWLLLCGQSGCGKTHLGLSACKYRLDRRRQVPLILAWREYFSTQAKTQDKDLYLEKLRQAKEAELLYIDDFLKTARNPWDVPAWEQDLAFELLDFRYNTGLDTVISTEWTPKELVDINEALGGRILQAAGRNIFVVDKDQAKNYRLSS